MNSGEVEGLCVWEKDGVRRILGFGLACCCWWWCWWWWSIHWNLAWCRFKVLVYLSPKKTKHSFHMQKLGTIFYYAVTHTRRWGRMFSPKARHWNLLSLHLAALLTGTRAQPQSQLWQEWIPARRHCDRRSCSTQEWFPLKAHPCEGSPLCAWLWPDDWWYD